MSSIGKIASNKAIAYSTAASVVQKKFDVAKLFFIITYGVTNSKHKLLHF
jgi:hypothetical protein